jgi:hypothetical protein
MANEPNEIDPLDGTFEEVSKAMVKGSPVDIDEAADWFIADALLRRVVAGEALPEEPTQ